MAELLKTLLSTTLRSVDESTTEVLVEALRTSSDLTVTPPDEYDFAGNTVACYRYRDGVWQPDGRRTPHCDVWIIWIDGYALDHSKMGFSSSLAFYFAMLDFFERNLANGNVGAIYNSPQAERNTLKDFLTQLDSDEYQLIPSYQVQNFDHLTELYNKHGALVVKPFWGGLRRGVMKVASEEELLALRDQDLSNHVAQHFYYGPEKRLWIADGRCPQGGVHFGKKTSWSDFAPDYHVLPHDCLPPAEVAADIVHAERMAAKAGLRIGSVDFIGDRINEINGAGTGHLMWNLNGEVRVDARSLLRDEALRMIGKLP